MSEWAKLGGVNRMTYGASFSFFFLIILTVGIHDATAFTEPVSSPPGGNISAPLTVTSFEQTKAGFLNVAGLDAEGTQSTFAAGAYLDPDGGFTYDAKFGGSNNGIAVRGKSYFAGNVGVGDATPDSGTGGQLRLDVEGNIGAVEYCDENGDNCRSISTLGSSNAIWDADFDTGIQTEELPDEDILRFDIAGTERLIISGATIQFLNNGRSVFLGERAGVSDNLTTNRNVFVGYESGRNNVSGENNAALGHQSLYSNTSGSWNIAVGNTALYANTSGTENTAIGDGALSANTIGIYNSAVGSSALASNTTGNYNTAQGAYTLQGNTTGYHNSAFGTSALAYNTTGINNTGVGLNALIDNTTGSRNTGTGAITLQRNTTGVDNTSNGYQALASNTTGSQNTAIGSDALAVGVTYSQNTAVGYLALNANTVNANTAVGYRALAKNTTGDQNTAFGANALYNNTTGNRNLAMGTSALLNNTTGLENLAMGSSALSNNTTGNWNAALGRLAMNSNTTGNANAGFSYGALRFNVTGSNNTAFGMNALTNSTGTRNIGFGYAAGDNITAGNDNLMIGSQIDAPNATGSGQLNIGNVIFGTGVTGTNTTIAGNIGIGMNSPAEKLDVAGNIAVSGTVDGRDIATDGSKLDGIETAADVTDTANVTTAGALMDSEVTNLAQVKAFDTTDYATSTQGTTADSALQDVIDDVTPELVGEGRIDITDNPVINTGSRNTETIVQTYTPTSAAYDAEVQGLSLVTQNASSVTVNSDTGASGTVGFLRGLRSEARHNADGDVNDLYGGTLVASTQVGAAGDVAFAYANHGLISHSGEGTVGAAYVNFSEVYADGTGNITEAVAYYADASNAGSGTFAKHSTLKNKDLSSHVTNQYGLLLFGKSRFGNDYSDPTHYLEVAGDLDISDNSIDSTDAELSMNSKQVLLDDGSGFLKLNAGDAFASGVYMGTSALLMAGGASDGIGIGTTGTLANSQVRIFGNGVDTINRINVVGGDGSIEHLITKLLPGTAPSTDGSYGQVYVKSSDGNPYFKDTSGTETSLLVDDASTTAQGVSELATTAEVNTGTDTGRTITPDALAGSYAGTKSVLVQLTESATSATTGDGKAYFMIPEALDGMNLVGVKAGVATAGTTGTHDIQIHNVTDAVDMLSTKLTIDSTETTTETAATAAVINAANDDVAGGDIIRIDCDAVQTTAAKGDFVTLEFRLP